MSLALSTLVPTTGVSLLSRTSRIEARYVLVIIGKLLLFKLSNFEKTSKQLEMARCALPSPVCMLRMIMIEKAHLAQWLDAYSVS